jgi:hypothetical protein
VSNNKAVETFREAQTEVGEITTLSTGVKARLRAVAPRLLDDVVYRIKDPIPPLWHNDQTEKDEPNLFDPEYNRQLQEVAHQRGIAQLDVLIVCGIELLNGVPPTKEWLPQLKMLVRLTKNDFLADFNLEDELDREYIYKKYVAAGNADLLTLTKMANMTPEEVSAAVSAFPGNAER